MEPLFATFREGLEFCINAYGKTDVHDHYEAVLIAKEKTKEKKNRKKKTTVRLDVEIDRSNSSNRTDWTRKSIG